MSHHGDDDLREQVAWALRNKGLLYIRKARELADIALEVLAEHDRQAAEKAWDEGYGSDEECHTPRRNPYRSDAVPNPYRKETE